MLKTVARPIAHSWAPFAFVLMLTTGAVAADKPAIDTGDTAWLLIATALVRRADLRSTGQPGNH